MHYCWGDNSSGQLGIRAARRGKARTVRCRPGASLGSERLLQAACGERHSLLLLSDGTVWSCGNNSCGQLGRKKCLNRDRPAPVQALETQDIVSVSCGKEHSLAICKKGRVFSWGSGSEGQLGISEFKELSPIPKKIGELSSIKIIQVSCGHYHSIALAQDSRVFSWGKNNHGQLGLGKTFPSQASPQWIKSLDGIPLAQVAAGGAHSFALSLSGTSYGWGRNNAGQLALSSKKESVEQIYKPYSIGELKRLQVTYISCGDEHTAVLTQDGKVFTFGSNNSGQLGHQLISGIKGPQIVDSANIVFSQIACGSYHTLAYSCTTGQVISFGCGSQRDLTSPLQPGDAVQNFNISNLISSNDFTDVQVKDIFAGANANFVTTVQAKDTSSSDAMGRSLQQISQINQTLIKKWTTAKTGSKEYEESKREICEIFSSPACLTASFLMKRTGNTHPNDVDLQKMRDTFEELTQKAWITDMITTRLQYYLLKALPLDSPHKDALSIFLLLPECPIMQSPRNWESLVVPFAKAFCKMSDRSSRVLEECWASLEESSFKSLIKMVKRSICSQMAFWTERAQDHCNIKTLLRMLKRLHVVNEKAKCKVPESEFYIIELYNWLNFLEDLRRFFFFKMHPESLVEADSPVIFTHFPFVFDFPSKIKILDVNSAANWEAEKYVTFIHHLINKTNESITPPKLCLKVRRSHLVEDALQQLCQAVDKDLNKQLLVEFIGEIGPLEDFGGVRKEFFYYMFKEMIQPEYGMFVYSETTSLMWFPTNPTLKKKDYFLFGILCGLSIVHGNVVYLPFPLALFKKLLDKKPSLEDLQELTPEMGNNLQLLLDDNANEEEFYLRFSIYWDKKDVDLIPNGSTIHVDKSNKKDFVSRCIDYIFNTSVKELYKEFQMGFYKVCEKEIINFFKPEELKAVTIGNPDYDWKSFEENSEYCQEYHRSHPTIVMFWDAFHRLSLEEKKKFLLFLSGNDRFNPEGIYNFGIKFAYLETSKEEDPPQAQTCFNILFLPRYSTMERVEKALQIAIKNNRGFTY
ncbi:probable E3 ubiquitin-protein ligase HERC6 [Gracilinanus agilis]|uniref:probable E3 ubiquitin-protein ligase HERC6 n=1 Tax=Gracilinanus agilis TaxID=191870 RepID=UPI001CFD0DD7|nr:probable E3 ubiquitin-protein ligase HERC6 [Gracilinanus agilis]